MPATHGGAELPAADPESSTSNKPLTARSRVTDLLTRYGLRADKGFGQNFLVEPAVLTAALSAAELAPNDRVLEVGPGLGVLTHALARAGADVVSLELDERLLPVLEESLADLADTPGAGSVEVVHADATTFDFGSLPAGSKLVANLPYNVATPVVARALESGRFSRLVFLVQREVGERLAATPSSAAYGALSLLVAHFGRAKVVKLVPPGAFFPPPKVTSAVVRIDVDPAARPDPALFRLIHQAFAHRRKTLRKNLEYAGHTRARVEAALTALGLDPRVRAEQLGLSDFVQLAGQLTDAGAASEEGL